MLGIFLSVDLLARSSCGFFNVNFVCVTERQLHVYMPCCGWFNVQKGLALGLKVKVGVKLRVFLTRFDITFVRGWCQTAFTMSAQCCTVLT